jgi:hypothetical protein
MSSPLSCATGFNAQHSPMGAFMSFTCGHFGSRGGIGLQMGQPADQNVFVGLKEGDRYTDVPLRCLPFYAGATSDAARAFLVEQAGPAEQNVRPDATPFPGEQIERRYGWCSDAWRAGDLTFAISTPFGSLHDPAGASRKDMRECLLPAVVARMVVDNTGGTQTKTGFFSLGFARPGTRPLDADLGGPARCAFAFRHEAGVAGELFDDATGERVDAGPFLFMRWSPSDGIRDRHNPVHLLGTCPGIGFEVPAGKRYRLVLAIGSYLGHVVTTRLEGRYLYARHFEDLTDVLRTALDRAGSLVSKAESLDEQLEASGLSEDQRFVIAHATHSYYGSTQLLEVDGRPLWVVNEGEYCMMNTLDLAVDQVFWELDRNPWVVRNLLDTFVQHYSYEDQIKVYTEDASSTAERPSHDPSQDPPPPDQAQLARPYTLEPGGLSFTHDMGAHNNFSPRGHSSYELANLTGCFSYMTLEQLCNWILVAACYVAKTGDAAWLEGRRETVVACLTSMVRRGGEVGFAQHDSSRCIGGQEITTYDSLDHSLAQTRNNVYIAVKSWASYRALARMLRVLSLEEQASQAERLAARVAGVVAEQAVDDVLPAVFEKGNPGYHSRILPAVEGCLYPLYFVETGFLDPPLEKVFSHPDETRMYEVLRAHAQALLLDPERRNQFPDGGIKLSSTSNNSWMSKIALFMHVARRVFRLDEDPRIAEIFRNADAAHVVWQAEGSAYWACSDQIVSGEAKASRYYPRGIATALWLS